MFSLPSRTCFISRVFVAIGMVLICVGSTSAQKYGNLISLDDNYYTNSWSFPSYTFESQFNLWTQYRPLIKINDRSAAKANHIKKITVIKGSSSILAEFELDSAGNPLSTVYYGKLKTRYQYYPETPGLSYVVSWSRNDSLMRQEFVFDRYDTVANEYGPCQCSYTRTVTWNRGFLLNEQNAYYNEKYEDVPIVKDNTGWSNWYVISLFGQEEEPVYFSTPFKTNYAPMELFKSKEQVRCRNEDCDACCPDNRDEFILEEAGFYEPVFMQERMYCGNSMYPSFRHYHQLEYNDKGLPEHYYQVTEEHIYEPPPPPPPVEPKDTVVKDSASLSLLVTPTVQGAIWGGNPYFHGRIRKTVSEKPVYTIEYEYYEE